MSQSSQTESEPEDLQVTRWDSMDLMKTVTEDSRARCTQDCTSQLRDALQTLQELDICAVERDDSLHEILQVVSGTILYHLDQIVQVRAFEDGDIARIRVILLSLLNPSSLSLLFEFRAAFHRIAARNTDGPSTSVIVCWADAILAKLGQTIVFASGALYNVSLEEQYQPPSVRAQKDDDMLRAAVQLPDKWSELVHVLTSEYVSPAAYRLTLSLIFGAHVMRPHLCGERADADPSLFDTLKTRIKRFCDKQREGVCFTSADVNGSERIGYAMFVSLYAVSCGDAGQDLACKPQTQNFLLEMIQAVLQPDTVLNPMTIMNPRTDMDTALILLMKWGTTMSWAWKTWEDAKTFNSELIEHFTTSWLYVLDNSTSGISVAHAMKYWDDGLVVALHNEPYAALSMMARLLLCGLSVVNGSPEASLPVQVQDILLKLCWSTRYLFKLVEIDKASTVVLFSMLCKYFVRLPDNETGLAIKDLILDVLSFSQAALRGTLDAVCGPKSEFSLNLERNLERISQGR
ncbi:hypothetical protein C8Q80DRAFT_79276 [Daedaleopsis nitida]|nr:hypothetical protein C8Q80DRAFT_79276 [Daedaleopsis nitida]